LCRNYKEYRWKDSVTPLHLLFQSKIYAIKGGDKNLKRLISLFEKNGASMNSNGNEGMRPNDHLNRRKMTIWGGFDFGVDHPEIKTGK